MARLKDFSNRLMCFRFPEKSAGFFIVGLFFVSVLCFSRMSGVFEYGPDEGLNLIRGLLYSQGHALYQNIHMDVPPVFVILLGGIVKIFGPSVILSRILVLFFSTVLLWGLFEIIRKTAGFFPALLTIGFLAMAPFYLMLSISAMAGVPSIALAVLSVYCMLLYEENRWQGFILLSGGFFAVAILTKLLAVLFFPAVLCSMVFQESKKQGRDKALPGALVFSRWLLAFLGIYFCLSWVTSLDYFQMLAPYLRVRGTVIAARWRGEQQVLAWIYREYDVVLLAATGGFFSEPGKRKFYFWSLSCFVGGLIALGCHSPVWYHHSIYLLIPMYWMASFSLSKLFDRKLWSGWRFCQRPHAVKDLAIIFFLTFVSVMAIVRVPAKLERMAGEIQQPASLFSLPKRRVIQFLKQHAGQTHLFVTDRPIFAYYANLPVNPYLTAVSWKVFHAKVLGREDFVDVIRLEQPEMILFGRWSLRKLRWQIVPKINKQYRLVYSNKADFLDLYVSNKLQP